MTCGNTLHKVSSSTSPLSEFTMKTANESYILRMRQVSELLSLSKSSIYAKLNHRCKYYDPSFPKPIRLGDAAVGWTHQSIVTWIDGRRSH